MANSVEGSNRTSEFRSWRVMLIVIFVTFGIYVLFGWQAGSDALDSDTTSRLVAWKMMRNGHTLDRWVLATPKFLPVVLDGALFELGGFPAVLLDSVVPTRLMGYWTNSREVSIEMAGDIAKQVDAGERLGVEADYRLDHRRQLEAPHLTNLGILVPRLLRPFPLFLISGLGGLACLRTRRRGTAILLAVMGGVPLFVGWLI